MLLAQSWVLSKEQTEGKRRIPIQYYRYGNQIMPVTATILRLNLPKSFPLSV